MRPKQDGLSDEKIDMLQNFLDTLPNAMHFEHLDGFFCALICSPDPVPFSEFLPYIFGGSMPSFESDSQAKEIMDALAVHWKHIADSFANEGIVYYPFLYADKDGNCSANDWADAFMLGVQLRKEAWADLLEDKREDPLLTQILALRAELSDVKAGKGNTISGNEREELVKKMVLSVQLIYNHYIGNPEDGQS